jgi:hypothetical protein
MMFPPNQGSAKANSYTGTIASIVSIDHIVGDRGRRTVYRNAAPSPKFGAWKPAEPFVMVKPFRTTAVVSFVINSTTVLAPPPSIVVFDAPCKLVTVIALPLKLMFSLYVPSATSTVSPLFAASIAA